MATREPWCFPVARCPTCGRGYCTREELVLHLFERRHWSRRPAVDRTGAAKLQDAIASVEARRQLTCPQEAQEGRPEQRFQGETFPQEDGDADDLSL